MATTIIGIPASSVKSNFSAAAGMVPSQRLDLALQGLAGLETLRDLARSNSVSRKFIYAQMDKALNALESTFTDSENDPPDALLFSLAVTKSWIRSLVVSLALSAHAPFRGIAEVLGDLFSYRISIGTIHNILHEAVVAARAANAGENLSGVRVGAHDEIFQGGKPVLTGVEVFSHYCYLLSLQEHRDAETWAILLLDLQTKGLNPDRTIADFGRGLRAGQAEAWPGVPCDGDTFHALRELGQLAVYLENRAFGVISTRDKLERQMERSKKKARGNSLSRKLGSARVAEENALLLADDIALLATWFREDVLALVGPDLKGRMEIYDFIVSELKQREPQAPHRLGPVRRLLENQRDNLLAFVARIDKGLEEIARSFQIDLGVVRAVYELHGLVQDNLRLYQPEAELRKILRHAFYPVDRAIETLLKETVRASSAVENFNSRLRDYFFLRQNIGPDYLELLRFYLNRHRFQRSERPERRGRSPAEMLTGKPLPHWLEQLGFERHRPAA